MRRVLIVALTVLTGCVAGQRGEPPATWVDRSEALNALAGWSLSGRIGVRLADEGFSGAIGWEQHGEAMRVDFHGPLGAGAFRISGDPGELVLETARGEVYLLDDPETGLAAELGWGVPLEAMRYWLIGLPQPGIPAVRDFDEDGRLAAIEQLGWRVRYERYVLSDGWELPRKLSMQNASDLRVRLVVSRWSLGIPE